MPIHTHVGPAPSEGYGPHLGIYTTEVRWWGAALWFALWAGVFEHFPKLRLGRDGMRRFLGQRSALADGHALLREHSAKKNKHVARGRTDHAAVGILRPQLLHRGHHDGATRTGTRYEIGGPNMLWGNDCTHPEGTWPATRKWLRHAF
jgi:hypothetical protein